MEYRKLNEENENQYILRICSMKEQNNWTWQDIADILNDALGHEYGESAYRKKYQQFNKMLEDNEHTFFTEDEYLKKIEEQKLSLEKERQKLYATKIEMNRVIRQNSRFELFYENVRDAIKALPMPKIKYNAEDRFLFGKEYLLTISDIHLL